MAEESVEKSGAKWILVVLLVSAIFAVLIIAAYVNNSYKRDGQEIKTSPVGTNVRG